MCMRMVVVGSGGGSRRNRLPSLLWAVGLSLDPGVCAAATASGILVSAARLDTLSAHAKLRRTCSSCEQGVDQPLVANADCEVKGGRAAAIEAAHARSRRHRLRRNMIK